MEGQEKKVKDSNFDVDRKFRIYRQKFAFSISRTKVEKRLKFLNLNFLMFNEKFQIFNMKLKNRTFM